MKTSIATVSVPGELREKLSAIADAGFDGVEIFEQDFLAFDGGPKEVGRKSKTTGWKSPFSNLSVTSKGFQSLSALKLLIVRSANSI